MRAAEAGVRIICFGDSLTAGFQSPSAEYPTGQETPYGGFLQEWLGPSVEVRVSGICGELTGEMAMRFRRDVLDIGPSTWWCSEERTIWGGMRIPPTS